METKMKAIVRATDVCAGFACRMPGDPRCRDTLTMSPVAPRWAPTRWLGRLRSVHIVLPARRCIMPRAQGYHEPKMVGTTEAISSDVTEPGQPTPRADRRSNAANAKANRAQAPAEPRERQPQSSTTPRSPTSASPAKFSRPRRQFPASPDTSLVHSMPKGNTSMSAATRRDQGERSVDRQDFYCSVSSAGLPKRSIRNDGFGSRRMQI